MPFSFRDLDNFLVERASGLQSRFSNRLSHGVDLQRTANAATNGGMAALERRSTPKGAEACAANVPTQPCCSANNPKCRSARRTFFGDTASL